MALKGFAEYFKRMSNEEVEHATKIMTYMNKRGGRILLNPIQSPEHSSWSTVREAIEAAIDVEKNENAVNDKMIYMTVQMF